MFALAVGTGPRLRRHQGLGLVLGLLGTAMLLQPWARWGESSLVGALLCLVAAASYGASFAYIGRYLTPAGLAPVVLSAGQLTLASGWLLAALSVSPGHLPIWRADAVAALVILGLVGTGAAYVLNYRIIADDGALLASTVTYLLPAVLGPRASDWRGLLRFGVSDRDRSCSRVP